MVRTGSSYASQSELPLVFGLGKPEEGLTLTVDVVWPGGIEGYSFEHQTKSVDRDSGRKGSGVISTNCVCAGTGSITITVAFPFFTLESGLKTIGQSFKGPLSKNK